MIFFWLRKGFLLVGLIVLVQLLGVGVSQAQKLNGKGRLIGTVKDEKGDPLVAASVLLLPAGKTGTTNVNGAFEFDLDSGSYRLIVSYTGKTTDSSVQQIFPGKVTRVALVLQSSSLAAVTVTARARQRSAATISGIYNTIRNNAAVSDGISLAQITRTPDNNVADAARRVNAVTIIENKFVVVRGMGERYNNIMLNGSTLPSTEANRRNFSLDLIPTSLVSSILVNKTATADLPADFAGGVVQVTTKEVPDRNTLQLSIGTGYNTQGTGKEFLSTRIDRSEYAARVSSDRRWFMHKWDPLQFANSKGIDRNNMNQVIPNTWGLYSYTALPTQDYQLSGGIRKRLGGNQAIGAFAAITYRNEQNRESYTRQTFVRDSSSGNEYSFVTNLNGLLSVSYTAGKHKIVSNNVVSRRLAHATYEYRGYDNDNLPLNNYGTQIDISTLVQNRLEGEHQLPFAGARWKWYVDRSTVNREQPDARFVAHLKENAAGNFDSPDPFLLLINESVRAGRAGITSSVLDEQRSAAGTEISMPFQWGTHQLKLRAGYLYNQREVDYKFVFLKPYFNPLLYKEEYENAYGKPETEVITPENFKKGIVQLLPFSGRGARPLDQYTGESTLHAGFALADWQLGNGFRLIGGVRAENFNWNVRYILQQDSAGKVISDSVTSRKELRFYPSVNLQYEINRNSKLRASFSKTVSRPDFREVAPFYFYNFNVPAFVYGNPFLENAYIYNYDLRYENYFSAEETISATLFYKRFTNPIETLISSEDLSSSVLITSLNQRSSDNIGIELDFRKSLGFLARHSGFFKKLFISGNASYMRSTVNINQNALALLLNKINPLYPLPSADTTDLRNRPLQGLSPYVVNAGILYQGDAWGFNAVYNRIGRRVILSGRTASNDLYENPRDVIDFQVFVKLFKRKGEVKLNISDILAQPFVQYDNSKTSRLGGGSSGEANSDPRGNAFSRGTDFILYEAYRGTSVSLSFNYRW